MLLLSPANFFKRKSFKNTIKERQIVLMQIRPRGYKTFFILNSAELLINVKMPTIVVILTFISMINTTAEILKARNVFICRYFSFFMSS